MDKKNLKNIGIVLMILSVVVLLGVIFHWTYAMWKIIDWATIVVCSFVGYKLYKENK